MRKFKNLLIAASFILSLCFISCSKSNSALIDEYRSVCKEIGEATKKGDLIEVTKLAQKGEKIEKELNERDLTDEEKAEILKISTEMASDVVSGGGKMLEDLEKMF